MSWPRAFFGGEKRAHFLEEEWRLLVSEYLDHLTRVDLLNLAARFVDDLFHSNVSVVQIVLLVDGDKVSFRKIKDSLFRRLSGTLSRF